MERIKINKDAIKKYWDSQAKRGGDAPTVTIKDHQFRLLEIDVIKSYLKSSDRVLDIGCGNGYATLIFAEKVKSIVGTDFSEIMIEKAKKFQEVSPYKNKVSFICDDILKTKLNAESFDTIITERCLINLTSVNDQKKAIKNIHRLLKPNGKYIMAEVSIQGHEKINKLRNMFGLDNIKVHWHNLYVDEDIFLPFLMKYFDIITTNRFGMYCFISKVIHPLLVAPEEPKFDANINEIARIIGRKLMNFKDASHQVMFVMEKR